MNDFIEVVGVIFAIGVAVMIEVLLGIAFVCLIIAICASNAPFGVQIFGSIVVGLTGFFVIGFCAIGFWCMSQGY